MKHIPVMAKEAVQHLNCRPGKVYVDCTLGGCGHAELICKKIFPGGTFIGIDQDITAIESARKVLKKYSSDAIHLIHDNFVNLAEILSDLNISAVDGILADLGLSFDQLDSERGFSFNKQSPLDMRMNPDAENKTAEYLINRMEQKELEKIFKTYGEERWSKKIASRIVSQRQTEPIKTTKQLADIICRTVPSRLKQKIHPATRVFMALRIAVNKELEVLEKFMDEAPLSLNPKGRLCVISFHSLEDRIVKHKIKKMEKGCECPSDYPVCRCGKTKILRAIFKKPLSACTEEISRNPMSRSAKLRAAEKKA